jgi:hypothetical protein
MIVGYARTSTVDQVAGFEAQVKELAAAGCEKGIVDQWYNDSTGEGDKGEIDADGPWKTQKGVTVVESPALQEFQVFKATPKSGETTLDSTEKAKK